MNTEKNTVTTIIGLVCTLGFACSIVPVLAIGILVFVLIVAVVAALKVIA